VLYRVDGRTLDCLPSDTIFKKGDYICYIRSPNDNNIFEYVKDTPVQASYRYSDRVRTKYKAVKVTEVARRMNRGKIIAEESGYLIIKD